jgi:phosphoribosylformimino-5-aminoimidazole carboxamide ribotide isomerase
MDRRIKSGDDDSSDVIEGDICVILFPAIDLKDGKCVRLVKGEMARATVYNEDPGAQARAFMQLGFSWLHVVDLDGAIAGGTRNEPALDAILAAVGSAMKVQLGGGIRDRAAIEGWLKRGVTRVILGTAALHNPGLVRDAARENPGRVAVGIDARGGKVAVQGWTETSDMEAVELARRFEDAGVAAIIYTDIERDGALAGVNWEATIALANAVSIPVIASGGLASMADIERLTAPDAAKLEGAIAGRALYDGRIDPRAALALIAGD